MQLISMSVADFKVTIREAISAELAIFKRQMSRKADCNIMTRKETAIMLRIDLSTLWEWTKSGKIKSKGIGRRVYYDRQEIENCLMTKN